MSVQETKSIARQWIEEVWNRGNVSLVDEMHSEDYICHDLYSKIPTEEDINHLKVWLLDTRRAFPDLHLTIDDLITEEVSPIGEGKVSIRWTGRGTHRGKYLGCDPTNKEIVCHGITILIIERKRIRDTWILTDYQSLMTQLRGE